MNPDNRLVSSFADLRRVGYLQGPGLDAPLEAFRADGFFTWSSGRLFLHPDWRGAISLGSLTDGSQDRQPNQLVDWSSQNTATYGARTTAFHTTNLNFFGSFLSHQVDGTQLQYLRNRYYDPSTGRFTQEDPIGLAGGLNLYGFGNGDPVNFSDPFGLSAGCCVGIDPKVVFDAIEHVREQQIKEEADAIRLRWMQNISGVIAMDGLGRLLGGAVAGIEGGGEAAEAMGAERTPISDLAPTHGVSRRAVNRLAADIAENGILRPLQYVEHNGVKYVVDGNTRLRAAAQLGFRLVPTERVSLPFRGYRTIADLLEYVP